MMNKLVLIIGFISLVLSCDNSKKLVTTGGQNISINKDLQAVKEIDDIITPYKENLDKTMNEVLSFSMDTYSKNDGDYNTAVGNLMADAVFELTSPLFKSRTGKNIDMVLLNHGGIRSNLPKGNITTKTAYSLMPFENSVVVTALKGSVIIEMTNYLKSFKKIHSVSTLIKVIIGGYVICFFGVHRFASN